MRGVALIALITVLCSAWVYTQELCDPPIGTAGHDKYLTCSIRWIDLKGASSIEGATFLWDGPSGSGWTGAHLTTNVPGMYVLKITSPSGCYTIDTVYLYDNADTPDLRCEGDYLSCTKTTATTNVYSDPSEGVTYMWYGDGLVSGQGTSSAVWDAPGTKKVVVRVEATGCTDSCSTEVTMNSDKPSCNLSVPSTKPACGSTGNQLCANVSGAASYEWTVTGWTMTGGQGTNCVTYTAGVAGTSGTFKLVVTGQNGCKDSCTVVLTCEGELGQGCTPGYWKNHKFQWDRAGDVASSCVAAAIAAKAAAFPAEPWSGNGTINSLYRTTFGVTAAQMTAVGLASNLTLIQALNLGGGKFEQLARHSVAGLLSACAVNYAFTSATVLQQTHNAIVTKTLGTPTLGDIFDLANNAGCPLDNKELGRETIVGGSIEEVMPTQYNLSSNYPNPFNPSTVINYEVPEPSYVRLAVYNMLGQEVATLVDGVVEPGVRAVEWNASNGSGAVLPSGIYIYKMQATSLTSEKGFQTVKKMMLMK